jgi:four helix bundle protein
MSDISRKKPIRDFRDLLVWQKAHELSLIIYKVSTDFPKEEVYSLTNQIRRAAVSVTSNIAEGFGRTSLKEKDQFLSIAHGSLYEVESQLEIAKDLKYLSIGEYKAVLQTIVEVHKLLYGLQKANKKKGDGASV